MVYTLSEKNNIFSLYSEEHKLETFTSEEFFKVFIDKFFKENCTIYTKKLTTWGYAFLLFFHEQGLFDTTPGFLANNLMNKNPENGCYTYTLSADNAAFYNIKVTWLKHTVKIYNFENIVALEEKMLCKDFEGDNLSECMYHALAEIRNLGATGNTISSCAYSLWKQTYDRFDFSKYFPDIPGDIEEFARAAYHGGLCTIMPKKSLKLIKNGVVLDVNSLYPYIMKNVRFPVGKGKKFEGKPTSSITDSTSYTYFVKFKAAFKIKENHIPFLRTSIDKRHWRDEILYTSEYIDRYGEVYEYAETPDGNVERIMVDLCLYKPEFELFLEHYEIYDIVYDSYVVFQTVGNIFDRYIDRFYELKKNAKTKSERRIAKMFLNALTGRMALKTKRNSAYLNNSSYDMLVKRNTLGRISDQKARGAKDFLGENMCEFFANEVEVTSRSATHPAIGAAITSEAMCYIIKIAQMNYEHFVYTDTDSLHMDCGIDELVGVEIGDELGQFKIEHRFSKAIYYKQKVYVIDDIDEGIKVTFAGLPAECRELLEYFLDWRMRDTEYLEKYSEADIFENPFIDEPRPKFNADKPSHIGDNYWNKFLKTMKDKNLYDFYGLMIPYIKYDIDYKKLEKIEKVTYYKVDIWSVG